MQAPLNQVSGFSKGLLAEVRQNTNSKGYKGALVVLFTFAYILGSLPPLPLIPFLGSSVVIAQSVDERRAEADRLLQQGVQHYQTNQLDDALESFQQALEIYREIGDRTGEGKTLGTLGQFYRKLYSYYQALVSFQQALIIFRELGDRTREAATLFVIGEAYYFLEQYPQALESFQEALSTFRETGDRAKEEGSTLLVMGGVYNSLKQYPQALESLQEALTIFRELGAQVEQGNILAVIGEVYRHQEQYAQALEYYQQAVAIFRDMDDRSQEGIILRTIGEVYSSQREYAQALEYYQQALAISRETGESLAERTLLSSIKNLEALDSYQQALAISRETGDRVKEGSILNSIGEAYRDLGKYEQALESFQQALTIFREISDRAGVGDTLYNIGSIYSEKRQYDQAFEYYQQALPIFRELGDQPREEVTLRGIKILVAIQVSRQLPFGEFQAALEFLQKALRISQDLGDRELEGLTLTGIGVFYQNIGQYAQALESLQQALAIRREISDRLGEGVTLNNMAQVYVSIGQYERALEYYQQALAIHKATGDGLEDTEQKLLNNIGGAYQNLGQYEQALEYFQQALAIYKQRGLVGNENTRAIVLNNIGVAYLGLGRYEQSLESFQEALTNQRARHHRPGEAITLANIGEAYRYLEQYEQSLESYQQALTISEDVGDQATASRILSSIGVALFQTNQLAQAEETLYEAITTLELLQSPELSDENRVSLFDTQVDVYKVLQQVLIAQNKIQPALEVAERGRARVLAQVLATRLSDQQVEEIVVRSPDLATIQRIAQQQNATLIQYSVIDNISVGNPSLYIWIIQPTGKIHFQSVDLTTFAQPLSHLIATSREALGVRGTLAVRPREEAVQRQQERQRQSLQQLNKLLIEPIAQWLPANPEERVIFIPQGELFLVPFPALMDNQGNYLIQKHTILTAPSIQVLDLTRQQRQHSQANGSSPLQGDDVLIVGNPLMPKVWNPEDGTEKQLSNLPGAKAEAVAIASAFATQPLLGEQATETAVTKRMPNARIIHLATHGLLEYRNPQDSGVRDFPGAIALAPDTPSSHLSKGGQQGSDGLLTSSEILNLNLNAELVVLSACDTGRGRIAGDGVIGLSRSLIAAGIPSVIVSLWAVDDIATAELMQEFYRLFSNSDNPLDKAQALRQAMLITMQKHPEPRLWAAFTLIGEAE